MSVIKKCVIPAAGMGTRFLPATKAQPKEMLPIVDKPVIQYLVEEAISAGIEDIIIVTNQNKRALEDHFDRSFELEKQLEDKGKYKYLEEVRRIGDMANIAYVRQPFAMGDGDAIMRAKSFIGNEPFLVLFGDDIIKSETPGAAQLISEFKRYNAPVVGVEKVPDHMVKNYGIVESESKTESLHEITRIREKPKPEDTSSRLGIIGKYVLTPQVLDVLKTLEPGKDGEIRLADAMQSMLADTALYAKCIDGKRYDTGDKLGFLQATVDFALDNPELSEDFYAFLKQRIGS